MYKYLFTCLLIIVSVLPTTSLVAISGSIGALKIIKDHTYKGKKGVRVEFNNVRVDKLRSRVVYFGIRVSQNKKWLAKTWKSSQKQNIRIPGSWPGTAVWFFYSYDELARGQMAQLFTFSAFVLDGKNNKKYIRKNMIFSLKRKPIEREKPPQVIININAKADDVTSSHDKKYSYLKRYQIPFSMANRLFRKMPDKSFPLLAYKSLDSYLWATAYYQRKKYKKANAIIKKLWREHPTGDGNWNSAYIPAKTFDLGAPTAYYGLRMLTECLAWRMRGGKVAAKAHKTQLTVLMSGYSKGKQPRNKTELNRGTGVIVTNRLHSKIREKNYLIINQMSWLFLEYIKAITNGRLEASYKILDLKKLTLPVKTWHSEYGGHKFYSAGLADNWLDLLSKAIPQSVHDKTDWWWVIHPSHIANHHADLKETQFVTGGMGGMGGKPMFISDDLLM